MISNFTYLFFQLINKSIILLNIILFLLFSLSHIKTSLLNTFFNNYQSFFFKTFLLNISLHLT